MNKILRTTAVIASTVFLSAFLLSSSCEDRAVKRAKMEGGVKAVVTTAYVSDGCAVLLEVEIDGEKQLLLPHELAEQFRKNGTVVVMKYHSSRIQQTDCLKGQPIIIDEIVKIK
ncbi:MAG: hypothetical protein QE487_11655 [Fluviicola sp.]|nr:hypothetical protein [Fluviicola sp.]